MDKVGLAPGLWLHSGSGSSNFFEHSEYLSQFLHNSIDQEKENQFMLISIV